MPAPCNNASGPSGGGGVCCAPESPWSPHARALRPNRIQRATRLHGIKISLRASESHSHPNQKKASDSVLLLRCHFDAVLMENVTSDVGTRISKNGLSIKVGGRPAPLRCSMYTLAALQPHKRYMTCLRRCGAAAVQLMFNFDQAASTPLHRL